MKGLESLGVVPRPKWGRFHKEVSERPDQCYGRTTAHRIGAFLEKDLSTVKSGL